jgi:hypothetical protein
MFLSFFVPCVLEISVRRHSPRARRSTGAASVRERRDCVTSVQTTRHARYRSIDGRDDIDHAVAALVLGAVLRSGGVSQLPFSRGPVRT